MNCAVLCVKDDWKRTVLRPTLLPVKNAQFTQFFFRKVAQCRSQWPRGLRCRTTAARPLKLWVRIPPEAWMFVCCECCVFSGRGLCDGLITRSEESYRLWRVVVCDQETSKMRRLKVATALWKIQPKGCNAKKTNKEGRTVKSLSLTDCVLGALVTDGSYLTDYSMHK